MPNASSSRKSPSRSAKSGPGPRKSNPRRERDTVDLARRSSGVLLHPTSLPGPFGIGDLGPEAHMFAEFLASARQSWWQMLPVGPVGWGNSPYSAVSTFAGNPLLISPDRLAQMGLLDGADLDGAPASFAARPDRVDFGSIDRWKHGLLERAFDRFRARERRGKPRASFEKFCDANASWLEDFALFAALKDAHGGAEWTRWEPGVRSRNKDALAAARRSLGDRIEHQRFEQWVFDLQWRALRDHCRSVGVRLIGDIPIFVAHDSADVWAHQELFKLDASGMPRVVAGVPPDYFSKTGQRWGNPIYDWKRNQATRFRWWVQRVEVTLGRVDVIRLDHFIGFQRYWEIPASAATAVKGRWQPGPREALFKAIERAHGSLPLIAEDLGLVTPEVTALREKLGLPGIKILQFAFGGDDAETFLPHNWPRACVAYTGSHDNDTTVGWFHDRGGPGTTRSAEQADKEHAKALAYLPSLDGGREVHWDFIRALEASVASIVIIPMQDLLGLGSEARMNLPGSPQDNWEWRLRDGAASPAVAQRLADLTALYGRVDAAAPKVESAAIGA